MSSFQNSLNGIFSSVPAGAFFAGNSSVSFPFISEWLEEISLSLLPVLENSSLAVK